MSDLLLNDDLLARYLDGVADESDLAALEERLLASPETADTLAALVRFETMLQVRLAGERGPQDVEQAVVQRASVIQPPLAGSSLPVTFDNVTGFSASAYFSGWPVAYLIAAIIFGVGLTIGALVHVSRPSLLVAPSPALPSSLSPLPSVVARITGMVDCIWDGSGFRVQGSGTENQKSEVIDHKSVLRLGDRLALKSGLLELTYDTGAKVILQGPVTYEVESPAGGYLSIGKLTARLEKRSEVGGQRSGKRGQRSEVGDHTFVVRTPTAIVTDLGTEFGVEVDKAGYTTSHVFRGSVELRTIAATNRVKPGTRVLRTNESARVGGGADPIVSIPAFESDGFVRELPESATEPSQAFDVVAEWRFDGKDFLADSSGHGHTLVNHGARQVDETALFDGKAVMNTVDSIDLTPYTKIRVSWLLKTPASTASQVLWEHSSRYIVTHGAIIGYMEAGEGFAGLRNHLDGTDNPFRVEVFPIHSDRWETFVVEYDIRSARRSRIINVFNDGKLVGRGTIVNDVAAESFANAPFYIGARKTVLFPFVGQIDNLKIEGAAKAKNR